MAIDLDEEGYLKNPEAWDEEVAQQLAKIENVGELSHDRMEIIKFMREYYTKFHSFPILRAVCKNIHQPEECVNEEFIDPLKAWKIAGLPKPSEEVIAYLRR